MADIALGALAIMAGAAFCFLGQFVLRAVIPVWGAFTGFAFGAGLVAGLSDERFLGTVLGWVLGLVFALLFALLAYLYYWLAVVLAMTSIGFALGSGLIVALGVDWNWLAVLVGVLVGALVGVGAVLLDLPMIVLVVLSAITGSLGMVAGLMLVTGALNTSDFTRDVFVQRVDDDWWWYVAFVALAVAGCVSQVRGAASLRRSVRDSWSTVEVASP